MSEMITQKYCLIDPIKTGQRIKQQLDMNHLQVKDLAKMMSVSQQSVYKWIKGDTLPSLDNAVLLCSILNTTLDSIIIKSVVYEYQIEDIYVREDILESAFYTASSVNIS